MNLGENTGEMIELEPVEAPVEELIPGRFGELTEADLADAEEVNA